jgi:hypothetical protein
MLPGMKNVLFASQLFTTGLIAVNLSLAVTRMQGSSKKNAKHKLN